MSSHEEDAGVRTVLRAGLALTMDPELDVIERPEVVIEDGRIASIRSRDDGTPRAPADEIVDLGDRWLLPGFVNAHTHAAMSLLRGYADDLPLATWLQDHIWPVERHLDADAVHAGTMLAIAEMLPAGVTTFADMYFHTDAAAAAVETTGARAVLASGLLGILGPPAEQIARAADVARRLHGSAGGRVQIMLGPHAPYTCPPEMLADVAEVARDLAVGVHIHLSETHDEVVEARTRWGASPVQVAADAGLFDRTCLVAHAVWVDDADMGLLAEGGAGVSHNPRSNMKLASGVAPVERLLAAGVPVGLGTDGAASTNQLTLFEEMRAASLLAKVTSGAPTALPARTVLSLATLGGARVCGLGEWVGSLTPGKRADILALDVARAGLAPVHDPFSTVVYSAQDADVTHVWCDGRLVARDGRLVTADQDEIVADAIAAARRLVAQV